MKLEMASSHCSDSPAKSHHFFKIILSDTDSLAKLMIPRRFVRKYGKNLDSFISLKVPNGLAWPVNLERDEGNVWIQKGWPEFARFYSIQFGHMLVFEYRGYSDVKVHIFDSSCTEIDYPSSISAKVHTGESIQVRKRKPEIDHSTGSDLIRPRKKRVEKLASHNGVYLMPKLPREKKKLRHCAAAIKEAEAFKSDNPFFFHVMRKSHVDGKRRGLVVMHAVKESYKKWKHNDQVDLQVAGKSWLVNCDMKWNRCRLGIGWDKFAKDNSLTVGDVCVFELIDACNKFLQVVIFRAAKGTNGGGGSAIDEAKSKAIDEAKPKALALASAKDFESRNPYFVVTMKESYVDGRGRGMVVRKAFEKYYQMWKKDDQVILQFAGETWVVYCDINWNGCRLRRGWDIFAKDNLLTVGDACVFELINASKKLLQVFIFRAAKEADCKEIKILPRVRSEAKEAKVLTSVNSFTSKYPFFRVKLYPSSLNGYSLSVPQKFIKTYITNDSCTVTLQISGGRAWLVKCNVYDSGIKFGVGWKIFARENHLAEGDICVFELINFSEKLLNVVIFRNKSPNYE